MTVSKMRILSALKLVGLGIAIAAVDLAIEAIDTNTTFVKTLKSLL